MIFRTCISTKSCFSKIQLLTHKHCFNSHYWVNSYKMIDFLFPIYLEGVDWNGFDMFNINLNSTNLKLFCVSTRFHSFSWLKIDGDYVRSRPPLTQNVTTLVITFTWHAECIWNCPICSHFVSFRIFFCTEHVLVVTTLVYSFIFVLLLLIEKKWCIYTFTGWHWSNDPKLF